MNYFLSLHVEFYGDSVAVISKQRSMGSENDEQNLLTQDATRWGLSRPVAYSICNRCLPFPDGGWMADECFNCLVLCKCLFILRCYKSGSSNFFISV